MAKLFKLTAYITDANDEFDESNLEDCLIYCLQNDLSVHHIRLTSADLGEWNDDHPINDYCCPEAEFKKYFKENQK